MYTSSASIVVMAPLEVVWEGLTKPELVKQYFFGTDLVTTWEVGTPIFFRGEWNGAKYEDKGTVKVYEANKTLTYDYYSSMSGDADVPENYALLTYTVEREGEGTKVTISQSNVATEEKAEHSKKNWLMVLESLKNLMESKV
jgi:uncharacterized protein YndB with AHSA1/START domain